MASAGRLSVLKLAVLPAPSAITPPLQLMAFVQLPPLGLVHVPLAACAQIAPAHHQIATDVLNGCSFFIAKIPNRPPYPNEMIVSLD
jgi:hypothetical protein